MYPHDHSSDALQFWLLQRPECSEAARERLRTALVPEWGKSTVRKTQIFGEVAKFKVAGDPLKGMSIEDLVSGEFQVPPLHF
jgi:hypothetical protein